MAMERQSFRAPAGTDGTDGANDLEWTGERYLPRVGGDIRAEHLHRYLFALQYCVGKDVLDIACGEGYGSFLIAQVAHSVVGVDIAEDAVSHAAAAYGAEQFTFTVGDCGNIPLPDRSVDVVVSFETIEHVADQPGVIAEMKRVLRPGGALVMSTPNATSDDGAWHESNPFHVHEMSGKEFAETLGASFQHVRFSGQSAIHGSVVLESNLGVEVYAAKDGQEFARSEGPFAPSYLIAVASDQEPQEPKGPSVSLFMDAVEQHAILSRFDWAVSEMQQRERELAALRADIERLIELTSDDVLLRKDVSPRSVPGSDAQGAIRDPDLAAILARMQDLNDARALAVRHANYALRQIERR